MYLFIDLHVFVSNCKKLVFNIQSKGNYLAFYNSCVKSVQFAQRTVKFNPRPNLRIRGWGLPVHIYTPLTDMYDG